MKSSGTLRLIKRQNITDSILKYIQQNKFVALQQSYIDRSLNASVDILTLIGVGRNGKLKLTDNNREIQQYLNYKLVEGIESAHYIDQDLKVQLASVQSLIPFLKKEYNIQ